MNNSINSLAEVFKKFPGIGQRQAERFAYFIARAHPEYRATLMREIQRVGTSVQECTECFRIHEHKNRICLRCEQESSLLIIVEKDIDASAIEHTLPDPFHFFVLGSLIPIVHEGETPKQVTCLLEKLKKTPYQEVIVAFAVHPDADHTMAYLSRYIKDQFPAVSISTLGRGLSGGAELEYADPDTIAIAVKQRTEI